METKSHVFRSYAQWIVAHRVSVIIAVLIGTAFLVSRMGSLKLDSDPDLWTPQAHPYVQATKVLDEVFGGRNVTLIAVVPKQGDIYQPQVLAKVQRIQEGIEQLPLAIRHNILSLGARKVKHIKGGPDGME